jgi:hypothetical protein
MSNENETQQQIGHLTEQQVVQVIGAIRRLTEIRNTAIQTANTEAEFKGLSNFVAREVLNHADELIGCWMAVHNEYEPLVRAAGVFFTRVNSALDFSGAPAPANAGAGDSTAAAGSGALPESPAPAPEATNIITLGRTT